MGRIPTLLAAFGVSIALATSGCRSCSTNYDYAPPVANGYCDAYGTHRCGSNSGGAVGGCATGGCDCCGESGSVSPYEGEYQTPEMPVAEEPI